MKSSGVFILLILTCLFGFHISYALIDSTEVRQVAKNIETSLKKLFKDVTHACDLEKEFENLRKEKQMMARNLNVSSVSDEFSEKLRKLLLSQISSVKNIKHKAEALYNNYTIDDNIKPFDYLNDKTVPPSAVRFEPTFFHGIRLNLNRSHVQLPSNIYEHHKSILNDAKWSGGLDQSFLENFKRTPELLWQYFGSETGMLKTFPGYRQEANVLDFYDCRRRLWYSQAINSPKDVLILLDQSGSMTGNHFNIAKLTVKSLIDTLQQDDFFNVITFQKDSQLIKPCITHLTQASSKNKNAFKIAVDLLPDPSGVSDVKVALRSAFAILNLKTDNNMKSSNCTKVLLLISDGIEKDDSIQKEIDQLNVDKNVVIFSYIIGFSKDMRVMKTIACQNGGETYEFPTVGNVWNGVLKYQYKLSRPIAESNNEMVIFTPLYLDSSGLGMMTTVSVGVFTNKSTDQSISRLLGVAGVDIRITLLQQQYPETKLGVFGHAFSINNNGLFLIHPRFRDQSGYLTDPATVYLDELEYTTNRSKSKELKIAMIDGGKGCMEAELDWLYFGSDHRRVVRYNATYCYNPTEGTPFTSGVSLPHANTKYMESFPPNTDALRGRSIDALGSTQDMAVEIANWIFCDIPSKAQKTQPASLKLYPTASELKRHLKSYYNNTLDQVPDKCLKETLWTLLHSARTIVNFKNSFLEKATLELHNVDNVYIISTFGYIFSFPSSPNKAINRDIFQEERYNHPAAFHIQGMTDNIVFTTTLKYGKPTQTVDKNEKVSVGTTLSSDNILTGVIGMDIFSLNLKVLLENASKSFQYDCNGTNCISHNCKDVDNLKCYLVDENAYIVVSNSVSSSEQGVFLGYVNGLLMENLEELNIYERREYIDNQAECEEEVQSVSSGASRLQPIIYNVSNMMIFTVKQIFTFISLLLSSVINPTIADTANRNVSCSKTTVIHALRNYTISYSGKIKCTKDCEQSYGFETINGTNLALIMVTNDCIDPGVCTHYTFPNKPVKQAHIDICNETLRYRKAFPLCYKVTTAHSECSDGNIRIFSWKNMLILFSLSFMHNIYL